MANPPSPPAPPGPPAGPRPPSGALPGLKGTPLDALVSAPLLAAARANMSLAQGMVEFIYQVGYQGGAPPAAGSTTPNANLITFNLTRPYTDPSTGAMSTQTIQVNVPVLGLVNIPALLVTSASVNFSLSVDKVSVSNSGNVTLSGNVAAPTSNTRPTDNSGKYSFALTAEQQPSTEGMSQMMDVLASTVVPIPINGKGTSG